MHYLHFKRNALLAFPDADCVHVYGLHGSDSTSSTRQLTGHGLGLVYIPQLSARLTAADFSPSDHTTTDQMASSHHMMGSDTDLVGHVDTPGLHLVRHTPVQTAVIHVPRVRRQPQLSHTDTSDSGVSNRMGNPHITSHPQKMPMYGFVTNSDIAFTYYGTCKVTIQCSKQIQFN